MSCDGKMKPLPQGIPSPDTCRTPSAHRHRISPVLRHTNPRTQSPELGKQRELDLGLLLSYKENGPRSALGVTAVTRFGDIVLCARQ